MIRIKWPDGYKDEAPSWRELFENIRRYQFSSDSVELQLAERARVWSGAEIDPKLPLPEFMHALADAKMFVIEDDREEKGPMHHRSAPPSLQQSSIEIPLLSSDPELTEFQLRIAEDWFNRGEKIRDIFAKFFFYYTAFNALTFLWKNVDKIEGGDIPQLKNLAAKLRGLGRTWNVTAQILSVSLPRTQLSAWVNGGAIRRRVERLARAESTRRSWRIQPRLVTRSSEPWPIFCSWSGATLPMAAR